MGDVEIKLDFAATQIEQAKIVFGLDDQPEQRRISFSEVINGLDGRNALPILGRGVVLRFREKRMSDATLKLRAPDGAINAAAWKTRAKDLGKAAKLEGDWTGDRRLISASLSRNLDDHDVQALQTGHPSVADVLSNAQQALGSKLMLPTDQAVLLGPIAALKWEAADDIEAEHRNAVGDLRFLESRSSKRATRAGPPRWPIWPRRGPPQTCSAHSHPRQARHRRPLVDHHGRRCFVSDGAAMTYYAVSPPAHQGR
jgi:hypothetical protein